MRSNTISLCLAALIAGHSGIVAAQGVTLREALDLALRRNPDILIAGSVVDSARSERRIAAALPNPILSGNPNTPYQYAVSIPIDLTPNRYFRTRAAAVGLEAAAADRADVRRQITFAVARAFFDVLLGQDKLRLSVERREEVRRLLMADSVRVRAGDMPRHNLTRTEVEMARADAEVARGEVDLQVARLTLHGLIGAELADTAKAVRGSLAYRRLDPLTDSLVAVALFRRPDFDASTQRVTQSVVAQRGVAARVFPTPVVSYVRQYTAPFESGHFYSIGLSFELPSLNLYAGERARAAASVDQAQMARRRVEVQLERDVNTALAQFRIQRALVERFESGLMGRVDESVEATRYAYAHGASSLLDLLDAMRSQRDVRTDYYTALHDYWTSVFGLNAAVGTDVFDVGELLR